MLLYHQQAGEQEGEQEELHPLEKRAEGGERIERKQPRSYSSSLFSHVDEFTTCIASKHNIYYDIWFHSISTFALHFHGGALIRTHAFRRRQTLFVVFFGAKPVKQDQPEVSKTVPNFKIWPLRYYKPQRA